jgi:ABC-type Fe3+ transport system permease subunit
MNEWEALRIAIVVAAWLTVAGGLLLAVIWAIAGGVRAAGPEDELMSVAGAEPSRPIRRATSFSLANVGIHGLLGILTAALITYAAARHDPEGYLAVLAAIAITAVPGTLMYLRWHRGQRPRVEGVTSQRRVEDRLPRPAVYGHGAMMGITAVLAVILLIA